MSLGSMCDRATGTLQRVTNAKDASGGATQTFANVSGFVNVPCDIQPARGSVRMQYMQQQLNVTHTVFTEREVTAKAGDVWVSGGRIFQFQGREPPPPGYDAWPAQMHVEEQLG